MWFFWFLMVSVFWVFFSPSVVLSVCCFTPNYFWEWRFIVFPNSSSFCSKVFPFICSVSLQSDISTSFQTCFSLCSWEVDLPRIPTAPDCLIQLEYSLYCGFSPDRDILMSYMGHAAVHCLLSDSKGLLYIVKEENIKKIKLLPSLLKKKKQNHSIFQSCEFP